MYSQKISVITINYNNCKGLQRTLRSVLSQTYPMLEYIVIDGGSTDGSVEEIRKLESNIDYWVSESDKGIYHAMNKGIRKATGDYCLFLNSGDSLHDVNTLSEFSACLMPNDDLLMGRIVCIPSGHIGYSDIHYPLTFMDFYLNNPVPHPACLIRRSLFERHLYDESLRIVADWKFFLQVVILEGCTYHIVNNIVTDFLEAGISSNKLKCEEERKCVLRQLIPEAILIDYYRFEKGSNYIDCPYDNFFSDLRKYNSHMARIIYSFMVAGIKLFSYIFPSLRFARRYLGRIDL